MELLVPEFGARAAVALCDDCGEPAIVFDCQSTFASMRRLHRRAATELDDDELASWRETLGAGATRSATRGDPLRLPPVEKRSDQRMRIPHLP